MIETRDPFTMTERAIAAMLLEDQEFSKLVGVANLIRFDNGVEGREDDEPALLENLLYADTPIVTIQQGTTEFNVVTTSTSNSARLNVKLVIATSSVQTPLVNKLRWVVWRAFERVRRQSPILGLSFIRKITMSAPADSETTETDPVSGASKEVGRYTVMEFSVEMHFSIADLVSVGFTGIGV